MRILLKLKSQRQVLIASSATLGALSLVLGASLYDDRTSPEVIGLGKGVASVDAQDIGELKPRKGTEAHVGSGEASFYGHEFAGNRTANGERFDPDRLTAAHRTLPMGSKVRVTNPRNGESVVVRINDRGPFHGNRVIDLSRSAARNIGLIRSGTERVNLALIVK